MNLLMLRILWTIKMIFGDLNLNEFYPKSWSWFRDIYKLRFIMNQDFSLIDLLRFSFDYLWVGFSKRNHVFWYSHVLIFHDMIFMQFLVFMKCLSHHLITSWYSLCGDIKLCMKYSWYYFDIYKWKVMNMHCSI